MRALYELVVDHQWQAAINRFQSFADSDAVDQLFYQNPFGTTAIVLACIYSAPMELVQLMITKAKLDPTKRCLLAITTNYGSTALHRAAINHSDPAVLELLVREHPLALSATTTSGSTPLQYATLNNRPAQIISLLVDATNALASRDYTALAARVHGDRRTLHPSPPPASSPASAS